MLVRQFGGIFPSFLCDSPKMRPCASFFEIFLKKPLYFSRKSGMLYPTKALRWIQRVSSSPLSSAFVTFTYFAIFFIYLLIIYPACPARDEKSDDPPARAIAFSFVRSRLQGAEYKPQRHCSTDDVQQLLFPVPPQKVCLNKHTCFFLTSPCVRVILISVN